MSERDFVSGLDEMRFSPEHLWSALAPFLSSSVFTVLECGRSVERRPLRAIRVGRGPTRVLLWSQMHGDESTGTRALADLVRFFVEGPPSERRPLEETLSITMVPMLNPDGAKRFQRANARGIDINRDARTLATPEARALAGLRNSFEPAFAFNLHDQSARRTAGHGGPQASLALLAPASDAAKHFGPARTTARLLAAAIVDACDDPLFERAARYDDSFDPRAFGEWMQSAGTSTLLVESGATEADPQKQRIRRLTLRTLAVALRSISEQTYTDADPGSYDRLPDDVEADYDVLLQNGAAAFRGDTFRADVGLHYDDPVARERAVLAAVGDLAEATAVEPVDVVGRRIRIIPLDADADALNRGARVRVEVGGGRDVMTFG